MAPASWDAGHSLAVGSKSWPPKRPHCYSSSYDHFSNPLRVTYASAHPVIAYPGSAADLV